MENTKKDYNYVVNPMGIETKSMAIIESEMKAHNFTDSELPVVKRVIHTTADFEYADLIEFHPEAIKRGIQALKDGSNIYADTNMVMSGINKRKLKELGGEVCNFVHDEDVFKEAKEREITRSMVSIEKACRNENTKIFAIGNAPTALFVLMDLINKGLVKPDLVVGVPVGFVGAEESKEQLRKMDIPFIVIKGRKGGSPVAATILNALMYQI